MCNETSASKWWNAKWLPRQPWVHRELTGEGKVPLRRGNQRGYGERSRAISVETRSSLRNPWAVPKRAARCATRGPSRTFGYGKPSVAAPWKVGRFSGQDFVPQPDGTLCCPAGQSLRAHERRREADGSLRMVYAASIRSCRPCPLRKPRQWNGSITAKPRQMSVLLHPVVVGSAPVLWRDWNRRVHRRACIQLLRHQRVEVQVESRDATLAVTPSPLSRAERAHSRLTWAERLARNACSLTTGQVTIRLFGVPEGFATSLGLARA